MLAQLFSFVSCSRFNTTQTNYMLVVLGKLLYGREPFCILNRRSVPRSGQAKVLKSILE